LSLVFTPSGLSLYRWRGEFTWIARGPAAEAFSEPVPLPTTVVGALLSLEPPRPSSSRFTLEDQRRELARVLGCKEFRLRGPFLARRAGTGGRLRAPILLHHARLGLAALEARGGELAVRAPIPVARVPAIGTALSMDSKTALKHMMYAATYADLGAQEYGIVVEVHGCSPALKLPRAVPLGAESRMAVVELVDERPVHGMVVGLQRSTRSFYAYVATPILLDQAKLDDMVGGKWVKAGRCMLRLPERRELKHIVRGEETGEAAKMFRPVLSLLSPGFDTVRESPRPAVPAILPGSIVAVEDCSPVEAYVEGVGSFSELGWGTVVPATVIELQASSRGVPL
jgi:hypothetical protein